MQSSLTLEKQIKAKQDLSATNNAAAAEEEATAALRAQLKLELQNKKQCSYQPYECTQLTLDGFNYCLKHILNDKNAPYKQCCYVYTSNGKRCALAAPKGDKKEFGYCNEHALKATLTRNRQNCRHPLPHSAEVLLHSLSHYVRKSRNRTSSGVSQHEETEEADLKSTRSLDPFTEIDAFSQLGATCNDILDVCSESESDIEASTFSSVWHDAQVDSSDNESVDSEQEDYLKHSSVYTAEEITSVTRDKLIRLQSLYIEQYRHLQHILRERKRKYLHSLKREKETCCNIYNQVRDNLKEQRLYNKLKAYNKYHKTHGIEAILNKRAHELRTKLTDGVSSSKSHNFAKCSFSEGGVKCGERTMPMARHCRKHILEDPHQVLFRSCGKVRADVECTTPVEAIFDDATCPLHKDIPTLRSYNQTRKDSESDYDDSMEHSNIQTNLDLSTTSNVKTELIDYNLPSIIPNKLPTMLFEESHETKIEPNLDSDDVFKPDNLAIAIKECVTKALQAEPNEVKQIDEKMETDESLELPVTESNLSLSTVKETDEKMETEQSLEPPLTEDNLSTVKETIQNIETSVADNNISLSNTAKNLEPAVAESNLNLNIVKETNQNIELAVTESNVSLSTLKEEVTESNLSLSCVKETDHSSEPAVIESKLTFSSVKESKESLEPVVTDSNLSKNVTVGKPLSTIEEKMDVMEPEDNNQIKQDNVELQNIPIKTDLEMQNVTPLDVPADK